jgi:hypothetical protein
MLAARNSSGYTVLQTMKITPAVGMCLCCQSGRVQYNKLKTTGNDPTISAKMTYSQNVRVRNCAAKYISKIV